MTRISFAFLPWKSKWKSWFLRRAGASALLCFFAPLFRGRKESKANGLLPVGDLAFSQARESKAKGKADETKVQMGMGVVRNVPDRRRLAMLRL